MGLSRLLAQVALGPADVAGCLALSVGVGWNQTACDWRLFMAHGQVTGFRDDDGAIVATAAALPYGGGLGWVSMVLVAPAWRERGLATRLLKSRVQYLQEQQVTPVLDATPAGLSVYRGLGFAPGFALERWQADAAPSMPAAADMQPLHGDADVATLAVLDQRATGLERGFLLGSLLARGDSRAWRSVDGQGFVLLRRGIRAWQIGPLVAADEAGATTLLATALRATSGPVFLDVPTCWTALSAWLAAHGFSRQRPFIRMALAPSVIAPIAAANDHLFVIAGPEFG